MHTIQFQRIKPNNRIFFQLNGVNLIERKSVHIWMALCS